LRPPVCEGAVPKHHSTIARRALGAIAPLLLAVLAAASSAPAARRPAPRAAVPVSFAAPAGMEPAGALTPSDPYAQILPSGRILRPNGTSVVVGMNALGVALTPNGEYAIVSNDDEREASETSQVDGQTKGGYSLAVVDTRRMMVVDRYSAPNESFFVGIVALADPSDRRNTLVLAAGGPSDAVYAFDLDASGQLTPDAHHVIPMPVADDQRLANAGKAFPGAIVAASDRLHAYVVDNVGNAIATVDLRTRSVEGSPVAVGFFPLGAAVTRFGLVVSNEGLMDYALLPAPVRVPSFATPPPDQQRASSLAFVAFGADAVAARLTALVPMDPPPDGLRNTGGAHPTAIAAMRTRPYCFVAMSNVDRVATVALGAAPRVVGGTDLRLYDRGPYGTQPSALVLSRDERRLYVALAGIDAIAVLDATDPRHLHRIGLIPTGWYPAALALSRDGKSLFVANAKGFDHDPGFTGDHPSLQDAQGRVLEVDGDSNAVWSTLERIELARVNLRITTRAALGYLRAIKPVRRDSIVPQRLGAAPSSPIKHVVFILEENKTYDSMLGDLTAEGGYPYGPGDPSLVAFGASVTPNLHALARTFGLAGNLFADAEESDAGHQFAAGGIASLFTERTLLVKHGRRPLVNKNEDPEDYPRSGYIFQSLALRARSFRDYGDFVRLSGYDEGQATDPKSDDPDFAGPDDQKAPVQGLGGLYSLDVPAPAVLEGHVDLNYPGWNLRIRDVRRADEFIKDFDPLVRAGQMPDFTYIWLPDDHGGSGANIPPLPEEVADGDRALGEIVEYLTHVPQWGTTAIFITPDDAQSTRDHVNEHRSYAIVVSPFAKRNYVGMKHLSTVSVLKTEEEILGLPALTLGDLLATDMSDFFTTVSDPEPYSQIAVPAQTASAEGARIAALLERTDQSAPDADSDRTAAIIGYARSADRLAADHGTIPPAAYPSAQHELFAKASALVR